MYLAVVGVNQIVVQCQKKHEAEEKRSGTQQMPYVVKIVDLQQVAFFVRPFGLSGSQLRKLFTFICQEYFYRLTFHEVELCRKK